MLTKKFIKKVSLIIICFLIVEIIRIYPTESPIIAEYNKTEGVIFLLDENDFLSMVNITYESQTDYEIIKEIISILTINENDIKLRNGFYPIIPENTKLISCSIDGTNVILNFSKEILNIDEKYEEKMIEAIVYSVTSLSNVNSVTIKIENTLLENLPNSKKKIPKNIDRTININKIYDINSKENIVSTIIYYKAIKDDYEYYIPVTKYTNTDKEKIEIIIDELKSSNSYNSNIINYMNAETKLIDYEIIDKSILLNFNNTILGNVESQNIIEEITYSINLSIKDNYEEVEKVMYYIDNSIYETYYLLLG